MQYSKFLLTSTILALLGLGCGPKVVTRSTHHGNELIIAPSGMLHGGHLGKPNRCDSKFGDGDIQLEWPSGKSRVKGSCAAGLKVGKWKAWYNNGAKAWEGQFEDGLIVGTLKSYHPTGKKQATTEFVDGLPHGAHKSWSKNGEVYAKGEYFSGKRGGCWETWHSNGKKATKGTYADGKKVLVWLNWTKTGKKSKQKLGGEATNGKCLITL